MGTKVYSGSVKEFIAGNNVDKFTESTDVSVKAGQVFKRNGKIIGLVVNDVDINEDNEPRPVSVLTSGAVYHNMLDATDAEKKELLANTEVYFRDEFTPAKDGN